MSQRGLDQAQIARALRVSWPFVHKSLGLYEAHGFLGLVEDHPVFNAINRDNMVRFLRHLGRIFRHSRVPVWMVMDNHSAHKKIDRPLKEAGIHPYYLAAGCGDLNGIEHLWAWLRERNLHNVFFQSLPQLKADIREFFCYVAGVKERVIARVA